MGYYSFFSINYHSTTHNDSDSNYFFGVAARLAEISELCSPEEAAAENYPFEFVDSEEYKWYDCKENMEQLSAEYPDMWFEIYGEGEEREDNWRAIFHNGKSTYSQGHIEYEPYEYSAFESAGDMNECPF